VTGWERSAVMSPAAARAVKLAGARGLRHRAEGGSGARHAPVFQEGRVLLAGVDVARVRAVDGHRADLLAPGVDDLPRGLVAPERHELVEEAGREDQRVALAAPVGREHDRVTRAAPLL